MGGPQKFCYKLPFCSKATATRRGVGRKIECRSSPRSRCFTAAEPSAGLRVRESWIVEQTKPSRAADLIPTIRFGKHNRYACGSESFMAWFALRLAKNLPLDTSIRSAAYKRIVTSKDPAAVRLGRKGGKATAARRTKQERSEAARMAVRARWATKRKKEGQ